MALLAVEDALSSILAGVTPLDHEDLPIGQAANRVLARDLAAKRTQPPFAASAMDGYAVRHSDIVNVPVVLRIIGEAGAGHPFEGAIKSGECVRIFTGAPLPDGADSIIIQEDTRASGVSEIEILLSVTRSKFVRPAGLDFSQGELLLKKGQILDPAALSLAAAMNYAAVPVVRKPHIAIVATGDELLPPGAEPGFGQIIASNSFGVGAQVENAGGTFIDLGIVADTEQAHKRAFERAIADNADVLVTLGGASVGKHDLVQKTLVGMGAKIDFWRIAMRPGKPLMFGNLPHENGKMRFLGLPGNPVSSLVCGLIFLRPLVRSLGGFQHEDRRESCRLASALGQNDQRQDYLRATLSKNHNGEILATAFANQDSSVLSLMARADCLIIRPPFAKAAKVGDECEIVRL